MEHEDDIKVLYRQEQLPIFQNRVYDTVEEARNCPKGDVVLVEDQHSGLVFNMDFRPELITYDDNYQNEQATSPMFREHLEIVSEIVARCLGKDSIVEVGCGKGFFLDLLLERGFAISGFDPAYEGNNPRIQKHYFQPGIGIKAKGIILRHVLEHIQNPISFLSKLKTANGDHGIIYIEVPCFDWICEHRAWFDIYYEHVNYFRLSDFYRMFETVIESGKLFGGQYLYAVADLAGLRIPVADYLDRVVFPFDFTRNVLSFICNPEGKTIWGGSSKGVIFALLSERAGRPMQTVIDINPAKQGKYIPATGLLVQSPSHALKNLPTGSTIYVMNSNYLEEIKKLSKNAYNYVEVDHG